MFVVDAGYILEEAVSEYDPRSWMTETPSKKAFLDGLSGSPTIGDHGPEYRAEALREIEAEAILECGCRLQFPVAPLTGEELYCRRHESWSRCRVPGGYLVKCQDCDTTEDHFGHNSTLALARARTHAFGKGSKKKKNPHAVLVGRYTETDIHWQKYEKGMN